MPSNFNMLDGGEDSGKQVICSQSRCFLVWAVLATIIGLAVTIALAVKNNEVYKVEELEKLKVRWCAVKEAEMQKCEQFAALINEATDDILAMELMCRESPSEDACAQMLVDNEVDAITLDGGIIAQHVDKLKVVVAEDYGAGPASYYAVAVTKKTSTDVSLTKSGLQGKKSCHTGYKKTAGWYFPIGTLMGKDIISASTTCDPLSLATDFFGDMCVPGSKTACGLCEDLCEQPCGDGIYCGYTGAFRCLIEKGDVAFVKHTTVTSNTDGNNDADWAKDLNSDDFELLCLDGTRAPVSAYAECSLGKAPSHAVVTSVNASSEVANTIREFLQVAQLRYGSDETSSSFKLFDGEGKDLLFKSSTKRLIPLHEDCEVSTFLGEEYLNVLSFVDNCVESPASIDESNVCLLPQYVQETREKLRWCVTSEDEENKCTDLVNAIAKEEIETDLDISCVRATEEDCASKISENSVDVITLDGGKIYEYSKRFNLQPLASELYSLDVSGSSGASYFAIAVAKKSSNLTMLTLQNRRTCHTGYGKTAGWVVPVGTLVEEAGLVIDQGTCDVAGRLASYLNSSCVPGLADELYINEMVRNKLCANCESNDCSRGSGYYGYSGALKCLQDGAGDVAFIKHTTVQAEPVDSELELLCRDGSVAPLTDYMRCNLAKVPAHALMTSPHKTADYRERIWSLLNNVQKSEIDLFSSTHGKDLLFKDSTQCLGKVDVSCKWRDFLGENYLKAARELNCDNKPPAHTFRPCAISPCG